MDLNTYQRETGKTVKYGGLPLQRITYTVLGLASEAGEVAGKLKKTIRDNDGDVAGHKFSEEMKAELGDVLWYVARVAEELGLSLEEVAAYNLNKLAGRLERDVIAGSGDER